MTPHDDSSPDTNGRNGGSLPPFATPAPFGTVAPFGTAAPFGGAGSFNGGRDAFQQEPIFTDPRQVLRKAVQIIRSRCLIGVLAAILVGILVGGALFKFRPIEFTAETTLLAQSPLDQILNPGGAATAESDNQENALTNHLSVMISRSFRHRVAESFTPAESAAIQEPYLKEGQQPSPSFLEALLAAKISVEREREKEFFIVRVRHISDEVALLIANHFAEAYLSLVQSQLHGANEVAASILGKQASQLTSEIAAIEDQRRDYRKQNKLISAEENQLILEDRIKEVNLARSDLRVQRAKLQAEVNQAKNDIAESELPFSNSILSSYAGTQVLRQQLDALDVEKDVLSIRYGPNHTKMVEVQGNIDATRRALARNFQLAYADLQSQLSLVVAAENGLNAEFDTAFSESLELSRLASRLNALAQEADNKRKTLDELFQRIGKTAIDTGLPADVLRVVDAAYIRHAPVPMVAIYAAIIAVFALGTFVSVPLAINFFDERINENVDLETKLRLDVIGMVPRLSRTRKESRPHVVRDNADLSYSEAFLTVAGQIDLISKKPLPRRILVTSTLPGEGKSTVASNLASAYTRLGRRTVLVDCDFRKPSQRTMHKIGGSSGLLPWARAGFQMGADLLQPGGPVDATALPDGTILVPAGASDTQPGRYLMAEGMARFFGRLRQEFEIIIVDSPPAGVFQDALIIARHCDETVFVARDGKANTAQLTRILHDFGKTAAPAVGIVLNGFAPNPNHPQFGHRQLYRKYGSHYRSALRKVPTETK
jgi:polysaccharide biosynthesis transport protein